MRIKPTDASDSARASSTGLSPVSVPTADKEARTVSLALSGASRVLASALARVLPELGGLRARDVLTAADRTLLARAAELADDSGIDPEQIRRLVMDLAAFRARTLLARDASRPTSRHAGPFLWDAPRASFTPAAEEASPGSHADKAKLALPMLSPRDERLARTILSSLPQRGAPLPSDFVEALLDPDAASGPTVDLGFLRQLVTALASGQGGLSREGPVSFERRDARGLLAKALSALALPRAALTPVSAHQVAQGGALLRERLPEVMKRAVSAWVSLHHARTSQQSLPVLLASIARTAVRTQAGAAAGTASASASAPSQMALPTTGSATRALSREDRSLLKLLYAAAAMRGDSLRAVDDVAGALVILRATERLESTRGHAGGGHDRARTNVTVAPRGRGASPAAPAPESTSRPGLQAAPAAAPSASTAARSGLAARIVVRSEAASSYSMASRAHPIGREATREPSTSPWARSFGSTSQLAARLASTYGLPAGHEHAARGPTASLEPSPLLAAMMTEAAHAEAATAAPTEAASSLDLARALGLGSLFGEVYRASMRARRRRLLLRRRGARPSIGRARPAPGLESGDAEPPFEPPPRRRRATR